MPLVKVYRRAGRAAEENAKAFEAIHAALVEAFKIPGHDRNHLLFEQDAAHFEIPPDRTGAFTLIEIVAFPGRSAEAKRALYASLARRFEALGIAPSDLFVIITEPPLDNWSVRNGLSSADAKPAFKLDV
jgi:phenylpyruvate tautomerase PptA (4-oxalocrotonate tautomerase family)